MIPILSCEDSKSLDKSTINSGHLSEKNLMNNAGQAIAQFIIEYISDPFNQKFVILAGPGKNGGDGIFCHYYLLKYGANSELILLNSNIKTSWIFDEYSIHGDSVVVYSETYKFSSDNFYIDGIFGIGLNKNIEGYYKNIIKIISEFPHVIAIDIPSGIYGDTGTASENYIQAEYTLTMGYPKYGHYFNTGLESAGYLFVLDIGYKPLKNTKKYIELIELEDVSLCAPVHKEHIHKYSRGKVISVAGSEGYTGACILAVSAAMTAGTGIMKVMVPKSQINLYENCLTEAIMIPVEDYGSCIFNTDHIENILAEILWADAVLFGPGLNTDSISVACMAKILKKINKPLVLDASGFQPLINKKLKIDDLPEETILTPHYLEFSKIFNLNLRNTQENPIIAVKSIIPKLKGRVLVLKGPTNIIVTSEGKLLLMDHGTSILATAGSGDVLTGIIASTLAQGLDMNESAIYATYLHAECGHQYRQNISNIGLTASCLIEMMPYAMEEIYYVC